MKRPNPARIAALLLLALLLPAAAGCAQLRGRTPPAVNDDSLQRILDEGQLILGLDADFPPMGFTDESGEIVGFDIDVAQEVCRRLGVKLVKQPIDWDAKEEELNSGRIDCIWNGMSVTPGRAASMCLSEPYMKNELIFVVAENSSAKGLSDLRGKRIGVQIGSTALEVLEASDIYKDVTSVPLSDNVMLLHWLKRNYLDAALVDSVAAYYFIFSSDERYFVLPDSLGEEEYAIGFRKDDRALRNKVQEIVSEMKADGTLGEISKKWFRSDITTVR